MPPDTSTPAMTSVNGAPPPPAAPAAEAPAGSVPSPQESDAAALSDPAGPSTAEKKPETPQEGRLLQQVRAREKKLVDEQQRFTREKQEFDSYKKRSEAELEPLRTQSQLAQKDPLAYLKQVHGWDEQAIAQRLLNGNKPGEHETQSAYDKRIRELEQKLAQRDEREAQASHEQRRTSALEQFTKFTRDNEERWPHAHALATKNEGRYKQIAWNTAAAQKTALRDEEILDLIEADLAEFASLRNHGKTNGATTKQSPKADNGAATTQAAPTLAAVPPGTSNPAPKPNMLKMTDQERMEHTLRTLKEMRARGEIA